MGPAVGSLDSLGSLGRAGSPQPSQRPPDKQPGKQWPGAVVNTATLACVAPTGEWHGLCVHSVTRARAPHTHTARLLYCRYIVDYPGTLLSMYSAVFMQTTACYLTGWLTGLMCSGVSLVSSHPGSKHHPPLHGEQAIHMPNRIWHTRTDVCA